LREYRSLGTAGGLYHCEFKIEGKRNSPTSLKTSHIPFPNPVRDTISANMSNFFVINADICCSFPLADMIQAHERHRGVGTMFGVTVGLFSFAIKPQGELGNLMGTLIDGNRSRKRLLLVTDPSCMILRPLKFYIMWRNQKAGSLR
jgi:hypothetical protein